MNYEEYLAVIEQIKRTSLNQELIDKLNNELVNPNINGLLVPKIKELIKFKVQKAIHNVKDNSEQMFLDYNVCDYVLVNFRKEMMYVDRLINLKQLPDEYKHSLHEMIKKGLDETYNILLHEAQMIDTTGVYETIINNNRVKWE